MDWIDTKDRLPEKSGRYLVYLIDDEGKDSIVSAVYDAVAKYFFCECQPKLNSRTIAYWAEAPEILKKPLTLEEKVMRGLTLWHDAESGHGCPPTTAECKAIGCPYADSSFDCTSDILMDAYELLIGSKKEMHSNG